VSTADTTIDSLIADFDFLDDWEERYRYVIDLGKRLEPLAPHEKTDGTKVEGCASQVWLVSEADGAGKLHFRGESDAHIVQGLIAILLLLYSDKTPEEILEIDAEGVFAKLGLNEALSPQRSNGLKAMLTRIRALAKARLDAPA